MKKVKLLGSKYQGCVMQRVIKGYYVLAIVLKCLYTCVKQILQSLYCELWPYAKVYVLFTHNSEPIVLLIKGHCQAPQKALFVTFCAEKFCVAILEFNRVHVISMWGS